MTSLRGQIGLENVLAANIDSPADNNADGDNVDTPSETENEPSCCTQPTELDELHSYELLYRKMMNLFKEILLMFLVCIVYTVLTHDFSPPKITKSPAAFPFFERESVVKDWYRGEVSSAVGIGSEADIGFVMFYAPWDAESQEIRGEFERAAQFMNGHIDFSAVNCWQPGSECRRKYNKVFKWPVLLAYTSDGKAIQYNGPKTALHMIRFLNNIMHPYQRVNSTEDIMEMMVEHDVVVLASVDCRPRSRSFTTAYNTALKLLEKDPLRETGFGIMATSPDEAPSLRLFLWNETLVYPSENPFKTRAIVNWLSHHMHQVTMWLAPSGTKSQQLASYMQGPTLILFTPQNPLLSQMDHYIALKQVALEYFSCNDTLPLPSVEQVAKRRRKLRKMQVEKFARCKLIGTSKTRQPIISYSANALFYSNYSQETSDADELQCIANDMHAPPQCLRNECQAKAASSSRKCMACQHAEPFETFATSLHRVEYDRYTTRKLLKLRTEWDCGLADLAKEYHQVYYANQDAPGSRTNLSVDGLACASNTSLTLVAMDSLLYHHFAESLGVDVLQHKRKTALVIVNPKDEAHAVFDGHFSDRSLREFILNFTSNNLPRALVDAGREFTHTHLYWRAACATGDICIQELNSKTFVSTIKNPKKVAVVFYYSRQCAFCTGVSHTYLEAARILANVSSIQFLRIDGDRNTLPWEYTMDKYPSILLFPLLHKSESRAYPETMPITLMNLLSFILANLDPLLKLQSMWEICSYTKFEADRTKCISIVRRENLAQIETTLREWRKADPRSRQRIIYKLQLLKNIHLHLATALKRAQHIGNEFERLARSSLHVALIQFIGNYFKSWGEDL